MADLNINITATSTVFDSVIKRVAENLGTTVGAMRSQFAGLSDVSTAAMAQATAAVANFEPGVQSAARAVIDLRTSATELNTQIGQTKAIIAEAGAATNVSADLVNRLASEQLALARVQRDLTIATEEYNQALNAVDAAQKEADAAAAKEMEVYNRLEAQIVAAAEANVTGADATMAALAAEAAMWDRLTEAIIAAADAGKVASTASLGTLYYHGTDSASAAVIRGEGLKPNEGDQAGDESEAGAVSLTPNKQIAQDYADYRSLGAPGTVPEVITLRLPPELEKSLEVDPTEKDSLFYRGEIPPQYIQSATTDATGVGEGVVAGVEAATTAREAETSATEQALVTNEADTQSEQQLTESILAGNAARQVQTASTEAGMAALREHATATAQLTIARRELNAASAPTVELENAVTAARERQMAAIQVLNGLEGERTRALNVASGATAGAAAEANVASEAYTRLAQATLANAQAQTELRTAQEIAEQVGAEDAAVVNSMAVAQENAARAALVLAAAQKEATAATAGGSEAQSLFRARLITSEYGIRAFFTTAITSLPVLIGVIAVGFGVRMVEAMQKSELELANLSRLMGDSVAHLADLGKAAEAAGASSDDMAGIMKRLDRTISDAASGIVTARLTLRELGVDMTQINAGIVPKTNTVLAQMADYLHANSGNAEVMRAAMRALGTESVTMGAFLAQGSQEIKRQTDAFTPYGEAAQSAIQAAKDLANAEAHLGSIWDTVKLKSIEGIDALVRGQELSPFNVALGVLADKWRSVWMNAHDYQAVLDGLKAVTAPPEPPQFAFTKDAAAKKVADPSELPGFREQLAEKEALFEGSHVQMLIMEEQFWQHLIDTSQVHGKDLIATETEIAKLRVQVRKDEITDLTAERTTADAIKKIDEDETTFFVKSQEQQVRAKVAALADQVRYTAQFHAEQLKTIQDSSIARITAEEAAIAEKDKTNLTKQKPFEMTRDAAAEIAQYKILEEEKHQIRLDGLRQQGDEVLSKGTVTPGMPKDVAVGMASAEQLAELGKINEQKEQMETAHVKRMQQIDNMLPEAQKKSLDAMSKQWDKLLSPVSRAMDGMVKGVLMGTQTMGQAFQRLGQDIVISMIEALAKAMMHFVAHELALVLLHAASTQAQVATTAVGAAQQQSILTVAHLKEVIMHAKAAAAGAFHWVMSTVPFPFDVVLAPAAAAAAFAGTMAFAEGGMQVPADMLAMVHKDERVLPARYSRGLDAMVGSAADGTGGGGRGGDSGRGGGGDVHHHWNISAMDAASFHQFLSNHSDKLLDVAQRAVRGGGRIK